MEACTVAVSAWRLSKQVNLNLQGHVLRLSNLHWTFLLFWLKGCEIRTENKAEH